ncbi:MAG TPA: hypothetical protein VF656_10235 [Pyrinomonadaceae bacterium]|jgi:hypothetical protein
MNATNIEVSLATLKENYNSLSHAYRRGELEGSFQLTTEEGLLKRIFKKFSGANNSVLFRDVAAKLFEQAHMFDESYKELPNLDHKIKEQLAEYKISAEILSYEISDYFLTTNEAMSRHFGKLAREASADIKSYYENHYRFVVTPRVKVNIVKQIVLGVLSGVNALYRSYDGAKFTKGLGYVDDVIEFLKEDFARFCERRYPPYGLLGLAYFLKGKLLLGIVRDEEADDCFRLSAENYIEKLQNKTVAPRSGAERDDRENYSSDGDTAERLGEAEVSLAELLALRRAALALAFGSGYTALINSRVKEANRLVTLARGIGHFNTPPVYAAYIELLYWSSKRAEHSSDPLVLAEAKRGIEGCRKIFEAHVPASHYPHRASIEHALVLHYLAQKQPAEKSAYYKTAIDELEAAVKFAAGEGEARGRNRQLYSESCYILSHILRYRAADLPPEQAELSVQLLRDALRHAKEAETAAKNFSRHKCEALLALCGVYADVAKSDIDLTKIDPRGKPNANPGSISRSYACKVLEINKGANKRISAVCYLRLVDYYLKNPHTYARANSYWKKWLKISDAIEHAFVLDWAARTKAELEAITTRNLIIDFAHGQNIDELRDELDVAYAKHKIAAWVQRTYTEYEFKGAEIKKKKMGKRGPNRSLQAALEGFLVDTLNITTNDAKAFIKTHKLFDMAKNLMESYLYKELSL